MCVQLLALCFCVSAYGFSVCGQFLSLAIGALFRAWTGAKRGCSQSSERQPQRARGTDPESLAAISLHRQIAPCACLAPPCPLDSTSAPYGDRHLRHALADKDIAGRIYKELSQHFLSEHMQAELVRKQVKDEEK